MALETWRFTGTNLIESGTLMNGTGGGAPALDQVSGYPMTNATGIRDIYTLWKQSSGAGTVNVDVTWGSDKTSRVFGLAGHRSTTQDAGGIGIASVAVSYQTGAYAGGGAWTPIASAAFNVGANVRHAGVKASSDIVHRSLRYILTVTDAFTLGALVAGVVDYDLDFIYEPGTVRREMRPSTRLEAGPSRVPVMNYYQDVRYLWHLAYRAQSATLMAAIRNAIFQQKHVYLLDHDNAFHPVFCPDGDYSIAHDFIDVYSAALALESLP